MSNQQYMFTRVPISWIYGSFSSSLTLYYVCKDLLLLLFFKNVFKWKFTFISWLRLSLCHFIHDHVVSSLNVNCVVYMVTINQCLPNEIGRASVFHEHSEVLRNGRHSEQSHRPVAVSHWGKALSGSGSDGPISGIRFNYRTSLRGWSRAPCSSFVTLVSSIWAQKGQWMEQLQMGCTTCTLIVPIKAWMLVNRVMTWNESWMDHATKGFPVYLFIHPLDSVTTTL